jgi:hypothetical protein
MDPDQFGDTWRLFESLDFVGLISVAGAVLATAFIIGRRLGKVESTFLMFAERNHADHERIQETLRDGSDRFTDHERRLGRLEGKTSER